MDENEYRMASQYRGKFGKRIKCAIFWANGKIYFNTTMRLTEFIDFLNFNYLKRYNTVLTGGFEEPFYLPPRQGKPAEIRFTRDYYRSALHELAHWCIAGAARRQLADFGYWYVPDGRSQQQQDAFYRCEVKPQAVEWALSIVCGVRFEVSVDNINNPVTGDAQFRQAVRTQYQWYLDRGFPVRAGEILQMIHQTKFADSGTLDDLLTSVR